MKKTYTINLSGKVFHIDEDALEKLQEYINTLKMHYDKEADGAEIMYDIENRIAELFLDYQKQQFREVIILEDVHKVIATMGQPNDILEEEPQTETPKTKQPRKLYRNPDKHLLGGVAAGLGTYWGISRILIRICFIILSLFYGIFFLVYIIMWIVIPKAKTSKEKLEMQGKDINIPNIEQSIKEEFQEGRGTRFIKRCGRGISRIFNFIGRTIAILFGIFLFLGSLFLLGAFLTLLFLPNLMPWGESYAGITYFLSNASFIIGKIAVFFLGIIPILLLIFASVKILFTFRSNNKQILLSSASLWFISLVILIIIGFTEARSFTRDDIRFSQRETFDCQTKRFTLHMNQKYTPLDNNDRYRDVTKATAGDTTFLVSRPLIYIHREESISQPIMFVQYTTYDGKYLEKRNKGIEYNWTFKNDTLTLDNYFKIEKKWRGQGVFITINIPKNFTFIQTPAAERLGYYLSND